MIAKPAESESGTSGRGTSGHGTSGHGMSGHGTSGLPDSSSASLHLSYPVSPPVLPFSAQDAQAHVSHDERREEPRYPVDARAVLLMVKSATVTPGRLLDLSLHGCQIRTERQFTLGIFVRVEVKFDLRGMRFRLSGVTQSIHDLYSVGIRFLAVSERAGAQLTELIQELAATGG